ncbi:MAG: HAD family hydrolase [Bacteroides sp.]|nr:HAD family hydrolase [Roseburia sp.]MCM1346080.1 HAD family hydrolase [Bacteroides sp.]MCM1421331.1 HAD family hydrolase [Bacteroides sp.]
MDTVILDFDGTIADTNAGIVGTMKATLSAMELPDVDEREISELIGLPLKEMFRQAAGMEDEARLDEAVETYRRLFFGICENTVCLFPHVADTLRQLHAEGKTLTVASSRDRHSLVTLLDKFGLLELVSHILGVQDVQNKKPAPDMALRILELTGAAAADAIVVGDTSFDIEMGKGAGCATCGVTYGNHSRERLEAAGADFVVDDFAGILEIVR